MEFVKTIEIELKNGQLMKLDMTRVLINKIKIVFNIEDDKDVEEYHIKNFLISSLNKTLESNDAE